MNSMHDKKLRLEHSRTRKKETIHTKKPTIILTGANLRNDHLETVHLAHQCHQVDVAANHVPRGGLVPLQLLRPVHGGLQERARFARSPASPPLRHRSRGDGLQAFVRPLASRQGYAVLCDPSYEHLLFVGLPQHVHP